jgi:small ubiquitin-related modifier
MGDNAEHIKLRFLDENLNEMRAVVKTTTQMGKLKKACSERFGVPATSLRFHFDGHRINDDDTPLQLEMEQEDLIEVYKKITYFTPRGLSPVRPSRGPFLTSPLGANFTPRGEVVPQE